MTGSLPIGLTGGIGSGKSSAAAMFQSLGVPVLDLDRVGHEVVAPGSDGLAQLIQTFGQSMLNSDGSLNRAALADHCFGSAEETARLNALMHPLIWQAEALWLEGQQAPYVIIEASVLLESGGAGRMRGVIVLLADESLRLQRVLARADRDEQAFVAIVARQCSDETRRAEASWLIDNNGSIEELQQKVISLHRQISATL